MVWKWIADLATIIINGLLGALVSMIPTAPSFVQTGWNAAADVWGFLHQLEAWIPIDLAFMVAAGVLATWVISMAIGVLRVIASYLTFGGGAT